MKREGINGKVCSQSAREYKEEMENLMRGLGKLENKKNKK